MSQAGQYVPGGGGGVVTNIIGGSNITAVEAPAGVFTINLVNSPSVSGSLTAATSVTGASLVTSTVANNLTIANSTITSGGTNANVGLDIVAKGTGSLSFTTDTGGLITFRGLTAGFTSSEWNTGQASVQTANATPTVIVSVTVPVSHMVTIKAFVNGFQDDFTDCVGGEVTVTAYRSSISNVTLVGAPIINVNYTDLINTSDVDAAVDVGTQTLRILVIGVAAQTWNWVSTYSYMFTMDNT